MNGNDERDHQEERANAQLMRDEHEPNAPGNHGMCSDLAPCRTADPAGTLSGYSPQEQCEAEQAEAGHAMASSIYPYAPHPTGAEIRADNLARGFGTEAKGLSLGEQQHDAARCDRSGSPHLGPCLDPAEPGRAIVSSWEDVVRDREADAESPERAAEAARALAEYLGPDEQGFGQIEPEPNHGPYVPGGVTAEPERPITDYLWSADPPARESGMEAGQ